MIRGKWKLSLSQWEWELIFWGESWLVLVKWKMHQPGPCDPKILLLGIPGNLSHMCTTGIDEASHCSTVCTSRILATSKCCSIEELINVVYFYYRMTIFKNEWTGYPWFNANKSWKHCWMKKEGCRTKCEKLILICYKWRKTIKTNWKDKYKINHSCCF